MEILNIILNIVIRKIAFPFLMIMSLKRTKIKKIEYQPYSVYNLMVFGEVPFSIALKYLHWQEYFSLDFQVKPSGGAHFY